MATESESNKKKQDDPRAARIAMIAAARRVIAREGVSAMNFANVAKEASVSADVISAHFQTPQELVLAIAADDLAQVASAMQTDTPAQPAQASHPARQTPQAAGQSQPAPSAQQQPPRDGVRKKAIMPPPLEQVLREVAPDPDGGQGAMARLERRVNVLEKAFADVVDRHEKSLRDRAVAVTSIEEGLTALNGRMTDLETLHCERLDEVHRALSDTDVRLNALEQQKPAAPQVPPAPPSAPALALPPPAVAAAGKTLELADKDALPPIQKLDADAAAKLRPTVDIADLLNNENYLSAARRAAMAAAEKDKEQDMRGKLDKKSSGRGIGTKFLLFGCAAPIVILATAFMVVNRQPVTAEATESLSTLESSAAVDLPATPAVFGAPSTDGSPEQSTPVQGVEDLAKLAQAGDVKAERDLGLKYLSGEGAQVDEDEAAQWLMRAAYKGDPTAEYWLASLYARGRGVPADTFQANHWYEAAAKQGNRRAMHSLAVANFQGIGIEKNFPEAARWFKAAAELGFVDSQFNLAVLYERGAGVTQSLTEAYKWYAIAAANGDKEADGRIAVIATQLRPAELALAQSEAASFKPKPMNESANLSTEPTQPPGG